MSFLSKVTEMPWATPGIGDDEHSHVFSEKPAKHVALIVFLAVVSSVFLLFIVAYSERMELPDWFSEDNEEGEEFGSSYYSARAISPQRLDRIADSVFGDDDIDPED